MMIAVDVGGLHRIAEQPRGLVITLVVNWPIKPFNTALLGVFFKGVFAAWISPADAEGYIARLILLGATPYTAMLLGVSDIPVPWATLILSVLL